MIAELPPDPEHQPEQPEEPPEEQPLEPPEPKEPPKRRGRPAGAKNKPKPPKEEPPKEEPRKVLKPRHEEPEEDDDFDVMLATRYFASQLGNLKRQTLDAKRDTWRSMFK